MNRPSPHRVRAVRRVGLPLTIALLAHGFVAAQSPPNAPPEGLTAGRWVLAPYVSAGYTSDSNIFRQTTAEESEQISEALAQLKAYLPFRRSLLELGYVANYYDYANNEFTRDVSQEFSVDLQMFLAGGSRIRVRDEFTRGFSDVQEFDAGGERVFDGEPFDLNEAEFEISRGVAGRKGYLLRVRRRDFNFVGQSDVPFFDYRGWDGTAEYRQPIPNSRWLTLTSNFRRQDHYEANDPATIGQAFREERGEDLLVGYRGISAGGDPFFVQAGWGRFEYRPLGGSTTTLNEFRGLIARFEYRLRISRRLDIVFAGNRRPLPSNFDTYYLVNEFRVELMRKLRQFSSVGVDTLYSANRYGDILRFRDGTPVTQCNDFIRTDDRYRVEGYFRWWVNNLFGFRIAAAHSGRDSNCSISEYDANTLSANIEFGWY